MTEDWPPEVIRLAQTVARTGGRAMLVGGAVRDQLLGGRLPKDLDLEIFGLTPESLETLLSGFGRVSMVGKSFGVYKLDLETEAGGRLTLDVSLPRRERKVDRGHQGFDVVPDPGMSFPEAAARRDFTINAMGLDLVTGALLDPFQGGEDLRRRVLRRVGPAFGEDPLRVYRAMQFVARFELTIDPATLLVCRGLDLTELPRERVGEEFFKLLVKARSPALGLEAARAMGVLRYFPELEALIGVPQDPIWHPEGDVWTHTLRVVDEAAKWRLGEDRPDWMFMLGALCHDFGKPLTTVRVDGRLRSPEHSQRGLEPSRRFLARLTNDREAVAGVLNLVLEHLVPTALYHHRDEVSDGAIRRLAMRIAIPELVRLSRADHDGSHVVEPPRFWAGEWLLERAEALRVRAAAPRPWLMGRDLLALGCSPGPAMGKWLRRAFELQLDGVLVDRATALEWAARQLSSEEGCGAA